ncbi:bifunctional acetate--CoA ligase family protein/GNAT family N-acetyltransferase [Cyanobium gracile UHCC 0139]|uniref:Bifunctional acetate--CoA ligase family protein/GNAT family N-acetyltransferase n=1 Tax=Cyanobium gracile UHCC 0139 TaxID=3110308 RepID=A0ABU5RY91_9CYAN|nr:bifunctional acetate--CoA ligase family protein/GNAT family N-acetyltransferase [Cyanobium gracile]MEA5392600.1 bifunctional acetate--CoA ligase family protein/GNAT family N-acetyltransferase [Cyanobium gracile UHCC 0139]
MSALASGGGDGASDRAYDILRSQHQPLAALFAPRSVAVIGASDRPGSVGRGVLWNLISHPFGGTVYPVNPKRASVLGIRAYATVAEVPEPVDLAVIATPAATVPALIEACAAAGVKGVIVLSAGFREIGAAGIALESRIRDGLRRSGMRLVGPNCLGLMNPRTGLNATFAGTIARPGHVGFLSQSGAICTAVLDWSLQENVGFSAFVSMGSMLDVDWGDLITYLGDDPETHSIVIYMESIGDPRSFLSAAREVALTKPIVVIKAGRTAEAAQAAASHTGALTGSDAVLDAAFRRCGVLRVDSIADLFDLAEVLSKQRRRPLGPRLTILTNAGGPGVIATDALVRHGGALASLPVATLTALDAVLPEHWSRANPIDILGDADPERYERAIRLALENPDSDGLLVVLTPQAMTDPTGTAERLVALAATTTKPLLASWMGGQDVEAGERLLNAAGIATYRYPDAAVQLFDAMWRYSDNLRALYETPALVPEGEPHADRRRVEELLGAVRAEGRTLLNEWEAKQVLAAYGIPTVPTHMAVSAEAATAAADAMGYPVVVKLLSAELTHKTDVGGVQLNLRNGEAVAQAYRAMESAIVARHGASAFGGVTVQPMLELTGTYELIVGSSIDPQFGPVILFGTGGLLVEVFRDSAVALPPLNTTLARRLMERTRIYTALQGVRGRPPVDLEALERLLVRLSRLVLEHPAILELDINPLRVAPGAGEGALVALDARVLLQASSGATCFTPRPAIRPYPSGYVRDWRLPDGSAVSLRPIRPEDEPLVVAFHRTLSEQSVYFRYFHLMTLGHRIAHERLTRICFTDYDREMALVAERAGENGAPATVLGVGRLSRIHDENAAEFAMLIADPWQRQGLGTALLGLLLEIGRQEGLERICAEILHENRGMQHVCRKLGFRLRPTAECVHAEISLLEPAAGLPEPAGSPWPAGAAARPAADPPA